MARGKCVVVTADPKGQFEEGVVGVGQTFYPGMIVQRDKSVSLKGGRHTYTVYNRAADGDIPSGGYWVVTERLLTMQGKTITDSYAAGTRVSLYSPRNGEELNLLIANLSGTGDDHAIGEQLMIDDGTGKLVIASGSSRAEVANLNEAITDPTADTLAWCEWAA